MFTCNICSFVYLTENGLIHHINCHIQCKKYIINSYNKYICEVCNIKFVSLTQLYYHIHFFHNITECECKFIYKFNYIYTIPRKYIKIIKYGCSICNELFNIKKKFIKHMKLCHNIVSIFTCNICYTKTTNASGIYDHIKLNHKYIKKCISVQCENLIYVCTICNNNSKNRKELETHILISNHKSLSVKRKIKHN